MASLPTRGAGSSIFHGSVPGAIGLLDTNEDFCTWLNSTLLAVLYQDAVCGDGTCQSPEEVPGVGRFGWCFFPSQHLTSESGPRLPAMSHPSPRCTNCVRALILRSLGPRLSFAAHLVCCGFIMPHQKDSPFAAPLHDPPVSWLIAVGSSADCGTVSSDQTINIRIDVRGRSARIFGADTRYHPVRLHR